MRAPEALDRILAGEQVEASQDVRELAELAALLRGAWEGKPTSAATGRVRQAALAAFAGSSNGEVRAPATTVSRPRRLLLRVALAAALVLVGLPGIAWATSENALPGQLMYPVKRAIEEVRLAFAGDPAEEAGVLLDMAEERLGEAAAADALGLEGSAEQALIGYDDAMLRFRVRVVQAQALGLDVQDLLEQADDLAGIHEQVVQAVSGTPPGQSIRPDTSPSGSNGAPGHQGKGKGRGKAKGVPGNGSSQVGGAPLSDDARSKDRGGSGGGGGAGGDDSQEDDGDDGSEGAEKGRAEEAVATGHDKAKGEGHAKSRGEGHQIHD